MPFRGISVPPNAEPAKTSYRCPHCGVLTTVTPIKWTLNDWICKCDNDKCGKTFYAQVKYTGAIVGHSGEKSLLSFAIVETYPKYVPERHESIPDNIWQDYLEACKCNDADAFKATVVMCRRMMQNVCLYQGAKNKDSNGKWISLKNQIKEAFPDKDYSLIHTLADEIKYLGDYGAHPQDDGIDVVKKEDSKEMLDLAYSILEIAYINPWKIKRLLEKRKETKNR
jgi:hypothetical protein